MGRIKVEFKLIAQGLKDKRRSMDDIASDETVRKKPRTSFSGSTPSGSKSSDFRPFQYEGKNFSDYARGKNTTTIYEYMNERYAVWEQLKIE